MRATRCRNVLLWKRGSKGVDKAAVMSWCPYVLVRNTGAQGSKSRFKAASQDSRQQVKIAEATAPAPQTKFLGAQLKRNEWAQARRWEVGGGRYEGLWARLASLPRRLASRRCCAVLVVWRGCCGIGGEAASLGSPYTQSRGSPYT